MEKLLEKLKKELKLNYPPHHWHHVEIWSKYWELVDATKKD